MTAPWVQIVVQGTVGALAVFVASRAWSTSVAALHSTYRPVLRPVPMQVGKGEQQGRRTRFLLKNIGRGPAVAIMLFNDPSNSAPTLLGELDLVEPLGPRPPVSDGEILRVGRRTFAVDPGGWIEATRWYRLLYQDIVGQWHETRLRLGDEGTFTVRYLGPKRWWQRGRAIPILATTRGQVTTVAESD
jgi:hypothetical protein